MKQYIMYECETCEMQSKDKRKVLECEAAHLGLTVSEMQEWEKLKADARHAGSVVGVTKNAQTDKAFDEAIEKLLVFEEEHEICS